MWLVSERTKLQIQAVKMSYFHRASGVTLKDRSMSSVIQEGLRLEPLFLDISVSSGPPG